MARPLSDGFEYVTDSVVTVTWTGPRTGAQHTIAGRPYRLVGQVWIAGRRISWLVAAGGSFACPDVEALASTGVLAAA